MLIPHLRIIPVHHGGSSTATLLYNLHTTILLQHIILMHSLWFWIYPPQCWMLINRLAIGKLYVIQEPIRLLAPLTLTALDVQLLPEFSNRPQVQCWSQSSPSARVTYLNVTTTRSLVYTLRLPQIQINTPHQYITIKLNAILFNPSNSQILTLLVIRQSVRL